MESVNKKIDYFQVNNYNIWKFINHLYTPDTYMEIV